MPVRVQLPDLEHWKAQVKCQTGCPVRTDAGRYVQLIAEGRNEEAYLVARAPNPFASVCGRVCAAPCEDACRRGNIDAPISIRALKRYVTEQYGVESRRPDTQDRLLRDADPRRQRLPRPPPRRSLRNGGARPAAQGGGGGRGARRVVRGPRPGAPRLRRDRLRRRDGAGRHDALRHPRIPPAPHAHPRGDPEDPLPGRQPPLRRSPSRRPSGWPSCALRASGPSSSPSACRAGATCRCPASSWTVSSRRWTTC